MAHLTVRLPKLDLAACAFPLDWLGVEAFRAQIFNALSLSFPIGEKYFIDSVREALPLITDAELREEIHRFIGQEATHTALHRTMNARLSALGLRFVVEPLVRWRIRSGARLDLRSKLAITMAYEHFTAVFGDMTLANQQWLADAPAPLQSLWMWHAAEECEHRGLAFDVYRAVGGGSLRRILWFVYVSLLFAADVGAQTAHNLYRAGHLWNARVWVRGLRFLFGRGGVMAWLAPAWIAYWRPAFQPRDRGDAAVARQWLADNAALFAARPPG